MSSFDAASALGLLELPKYIERVEQKLTSIVASDNESLSKPIARLLNARGKRLRPSLVIAAATIQGRKVNDTVISACAAIELVHLASLVHDDIIDEATSRWGIPTISSQEGTGQAIIVGDYLLATACREAATISTEAGQLVAQTIAKLSIGQAQELVDQHNVHRTVGAYFDSIKGKTGALFAGACQLGGLVAKLSEEEVQALTAFGENFGVSFQLTDDLLDFLSSEELSGKPVGQDIAEGVYTLPLLFGLAGPSGKELKALLNQSNIHQAIADLLLKDGSIKETTVKIKKCNHVATQALDIFDKSKPIGNLQNFPSAYFDWAMKNVAAEKYKNVA